MSLFSEKRSHHRISTNFAIELELANRQITKGTAINIGQGGMLLKSDAGRKISRLDDVLVYLPIHQGQSNYMIPAMVTRVNKNEIGLFFYKDPSDYIENYL